MFADSCELFWVDIPDNDPRKGTGSPGNLQTILQTMLQTK